MADIRNVPKDNQISQRSDVGEIQSGGNGWDTAAPTTPGSPQTDPYSPSMLGGDAAGSSDHNSSWLESTSNE